MTANALKKVNEQDGMVKKKETKKENYNFF